MTREELLAEAGKVGLTVDEAWDDDTLLAKIVEAQEVQEAPDEQKPKKAKKAESSKTIKCRILRDRWDENGDRVPAGTEVDVSVDDALDGIEAGTLERVKK